MTFVFIVHTSYTVDTLSLPIHHDSESVTMHSAGICFGKVPQFVLGKFDLLYKNPSYQWPKCLHTYTYMYDRSLF